MGTENVEIDQAALWAMVHAQLRPKASDGSANGCLNRLTNERLGAARVLVDAQRRMCGWSAGPLRRWAPWTPSTRGRISSRMNVRSWWFASIAGYCSSTAITAWQPGWLNCRPAHRPVCTASCWCRCAVRRRRLDLTVRSLPIFLTRMASRRGRTVVRIGRRECPSATSSATGRGTGWPPLLAWRANRASSPALAQSD